MIPPPFGCDLRHTSASVAQLQNWPPKFVSGDLDNRTVNSTVDVEVDRSRSFASEGVSICPPRLAMRMLAILKMPTRI